MGVEIGHGVGCDEVGRSGEEWKWGWGVKVQRGIVSALCVHRSILPNWVLRRGGEEHGVGRSGSGAWCE